MDMVRFVGAILVVAALASAVPVPHKHEDGLSSSASVNGSLEVPEAGLNVEGNADLETDGISATNLGRIARSENSEDHVHVDGDSDEDDENAGDEEANVDLVKREVDEDDDADDDSDSDDDDDDDDLADDDDTDDDDDADARIVKREADSSSSEESNDNEAENAEAEPVAEVASPIETVAAAVEDAAASEDAAPAKKKRETSTSQVVLDKLASLVDTVQNNPEFQEIHNAVVASEASQPAAPAVA